MVGRKNLEGKFFVFNFESDYTCGTSALNLFKVSKGSLEEVWNPCEHSSGPGEYEFDDFENELARKYLVEQRTREVYSLGDGSGLHHPESFLGFNLNWFYDKNNWGTRTALSRHFWEDFFKEAGIRLKFYETPKLSKPITSKKFD
ncbi:MAG: hypothetical protein AABX93_01805 [Nanoarchaeota archaeon]